MYKFSLIYILKIFIIFTLVFGTDAYVQNSKQKSLKKIPKKDRIELAIQQEFESTIDPTLNIVPSERLYDVRKQIIRKQALSPRSSNSITWEERGPNNIAGRTRSILIDQADPTGNTVLAGSVSGGIWKSGNAKSSAPQWNQTNGLMDNLAISCLYQDSTDPSIIYAGTGEGYFNVDAVKGNGIWKSQDGGANWTRLISTANDDFTYIQKIAMNSSGHLFACTRSAGVMRSVDAGNSWNKVLGYNYGATTNRAADIVITTDDKIFVSMGLFDSDGIYRSTNNGVSWTKLTNGLPVSGYERIELAGAPSNPDILYALFQDATSYECSGIYKTTNGGDSWTTLNIPNALGMNNFARSQAWYNLSVAVDPDDPNRLIVGGIDLHLSENGGQTWTQISQWQGTSPYSYVHPDQHEIVFEDNSGNAVYFGNDGGVARCDDITEANLVLEHINTGYNVTQFYAAAVHPENASPQLLAGAQDNGTQLFNQPGENATIEVAGGDGGFCHIDQNDPSVQIASYVYNNYFISTNGGSSFSLKSFNNSGRFINPSCYDSGTQKLYASSEDGKYFRWNNPAQAGNDTDEVSVSAFANAKITALEISPNQANTIYFGLDNGTVVKVNNVNNGNSKSGTIVFSGQTGNISSICVNANNESHILLTFSNYGVQSIKETTNGGQSWVDVEGNLPDFPVRWIEFNPHDPDGALIATELGVWSTDMLNGSSTNWISDNGPIQFVRVDQLVFRPSDNYLLAATHGRGLFSSTSFVQPLVSFDIANLTKSESSETGNFGSCSLNDKTINVPVSVSSVPQQNFSVSFSILGSSTATQGEDFSLLTSSLTFGPGLPLQQNMILKIIDESVFESDENIVIELNGNTNYIGNNNQVEILISDDDHDPTSASGINEFLVGNEGGSVYKYPFGGYYEDERTQILYKAEELEAAGISTGNIEKLAFNIVQKVSDGPFNNMTIKLKEVSMNNLGPVGTPFVQYATTVFSGNINTVTGWNEFDFDQPFYWNGISDIIVDICFDNQSWTDDDYIATTNTSFVSVQYKYSDSSSGCSFNNVSAVDYSRPDIKFYSSADIQIADVICSKNSTIIQGQTAHFYSDGKLIASIENLNGNDISCLSMEIDRAGNNILYPSWMQGSGVSEKSFYIDAMFESPYKLSLYFMPDELAEWSDPYALNMIKTPGTIGGSDGSDFTLVENDQMEIEVLNSGSIVYRAVFSDFSGFALTDLETNTLGLELLSFDVSKNNDHNLVSWQFNEEAKASIMHIEKLSENAEDFEVIHQQAAISEDISYHDNNIKPGTVYYRLRLINENGIEQISDLRKVYREEIESAVKLHVYPNPAKDFISIKINSDYIKQATKLRILGSRGEIIYNQKITTPAELDEIAVDSLKKGVYFIEIKNGVGESFVTKFIKL